MFLENTTSDFIGNTFKFIYLLYELLILVNFLSYFM